MEETVEQVKELVQNPQKIHPVRTALKTFHKNPKFYITSFVWSIISTAIGIGLFLNQEHILAVRKAENAKLEANNTRIQTALQVLESQDQYKINQQLQKDLKENHDVLTNSMQVFQNISDLPASDKKLADFKTRYAKVLKYLSDKNNASASAALTSLSSDVSSETQAVSANIASSEGPNPANAPHSNAPPGSGFSRQVVNVNGSNYVVDLIAGNLSSTRVIVDTASASDCSNNCPVLSLGDYVSRNGAYAGVNGSYFCPAEYPSCAGKTNTFDTLLMNKNKVYFNSANNVYSTVPAVIFGGSFIRFVGASEEWGRDTGIDSMIANRPLLVSGGKSVFSGSGEPKEGVPGTRGFVANKGNNVYIGVLHNVTVAQGADVLAAMGMDNALNLDSGGSVALWANGGYQVGPGRNIPNAVLFVNK